MKIFRYICASIIFAASGYCAYNCIDKLSDLPYIAFLLTFSLGVIVLCDGGLNRNASGKKKS
mgnify:CR=1 FL=1